MKTTYDRKKHIQERQSIRKAIGRERRTIKIVGDVIEERENDPSRKCTCKKGYTECPACLAWKWKEEVK